MVSIIIPARNEKFLQKTIDCLIEKATGKYEIIVGLDGYWPVPQIKDHPNVTLLHMPKPIGMRSMINSMVDISRGEFIMKIDAHCNISKGFDSKLSKICKTGMVCVPRQFSLHDETWTPNKKKRFVDYWYVTAPTIHLPEIERGNRNRGFQTDRWHMYRRNPGVNEKLIDDVMTMQGSFWFMTKEHFYNIEVNDPESEKNFSYEGIEIALKTWLSGGRVVVVKKVWYAHLHKGKKHGRGFYMPKTTAYVGAEYVIDLFLRKKWKKMVHDVKWLIDKFGPVPTWENFDWSHEW